MTNIVVAAIILIAHIESNGDPNAIGDHGRAVGYLGTHMCMVREVNRKFHTHYTGRDRLDPVASAEMAMLFLTDLAEHKNIQDPVVLAGYWNRPASGGSRAYKRKLRTLVR